MANEIVSTTTTLAGLQERIQAETLANFYTQSRLFNAVYTKEANGAGIVQFASPIVPSGVTVSAQTEANAVTSVAMTMAAKTATLVSYPYQTTVSKLALNGGQFVASDMAGSCSMFIVNAVDTAIAAQFADFTPTVSGTVNYSNFTTAHKTLQNQGFMGTPVAVLGATMWSTLRADLVSKYIPIVNNQVGVAGQAMLVDGVEIYVVPDFILPSIDAQKYGAIFYREVGVGLGYHSPLITAEFVDYDIANYLFGARAECAATEISAFGGVKIQA